MFYIKKIVQNIEEENRSLLVKSVKVLKIPWEAENWNHQNNEIHSNRDQSQRAQKILSAVLVSYIGTSSRLFHFWSNSLLNAWESNEGWPRSLSPLTHVRNPGETPGFCSQIGSAWDSAAKGREPTDGDLCACLSLKSTSQIKNKWEPKATWTTVSPKHRKPVESIHKSVPGWDREMWSLTHWDYFCENGVQYPCPGEHQWCKLLSVFSSPLKGFVQATLTNSAIKYSETGGWAEWAWARSDFLTCCSKHGNHFLVGHVPDEERVLGEFSWAQQQQTATQLCFLHKNYKALLITTPLIYCFHL